METASILGRSSSKPSASDENERYYEQLGSPDLRKHYMSPTISAASKAVSSRKNILGERNEANTTHVDEKGTTTTPVTSLVSEDFSSRPYDPVIDYSSPRPRFLRYNPNRHRELILGLENSNVGGNDGLSLSSCSTESGMKCDDEEGGSCDEQGDEGVEEIAENEVIEEKVEEIMRVDENVEGEIEGSDEEDEEVEEEMKGFKMKGLLKRLLVFVALVLVISHMASVNQESIYGSAEESYLRSENYTCEIDLLKKLEGGSSIWDQKKELSFIERTGGTIGMGIEEGKMVASMKMDMVVEHQIVMDEEILEETKVQDENLEAVEHVDETGQVLAVEQAKGRETIDMAEKEENMGVQDLGEVEVLQVGDIEEVHDQMVENFESQDGVVLGIDESFEQVVNENLVSVASSSFEVDGEIVVKSIDEIVESKSEVPEYSSDNMAEYVMSDGLDNDHTGRGAISDSIAVVQKLWEELLAYMKSETLYKPIVVSIIAVIAASVAFIFHFRKKNAINKDSSVIANTGSMKNLIIEKKKVISKESTISHEYNSALANREKDDIIEQDVYSSFRRMSLASDSKHFSSEASEGYRSKAPTVELLGEFVVGEVSSSLRSCGLKDQRKGEETNGHIRNKAHSVSILQQPPVSVFSYTSAFSHRSYASEKKMKQNESEISSMDTSHGSYTSKKIVKIKEGGKSGEVKIIATPVRRSSRIRSKVAKTP